MINNDSGLLIVFNVNWSMEHPLISGQSGDGDGVRMRSFNVLQTDVGKTSPDQVIDSTCTFTVCEGPYLLSKQSIAPIFQFTCACCNASPKDRSLKVVLYL